MTSSREFQRRRRPVPSSRTTGSLWNCFSFFLVHLLALGIVLNGGGGGSSSSMIVAAAAEESSTAYAAYVPTEHDRLRHLLSVEDFLLHGEIEKDDDNDNDSDNNNIHNNDNGEGEDSQQEEVVVEPLVEYATENDNDESIEGEGDEVVEEEEDEDVDESLDLGEQDAESAAWNVLHTVVEKSGLSHRLTRLYEKAHSASCRAKIAEHFGYFIAALGQEEPLPFSNIKFNNTCPEPVYADWKNLPDGMHIGMIQNRTYQPDRNGNKNETINAEKYYIQDPNDLRLLYAILTHDDAPGTIRFIEAVQEEEGQHVFVVHVDGKEQHEATYRTLVDYANSNHTRNVYILPPPLRQRVNWGGFQMVNATLQILRFALGLTPEFLSLPSLDFHKVVHVASSTYPLASKTEIRHKIASFPLDANLFHVIMKPSRPAPHGWFYFVECDDALHRIGPLPPLRNETSNAELYTSSQWFILSRDFALYLAKAEPGTFVHAFLDYAQHIVVADETFFGTVLRNTHFCMTHHNRNFLHVHFDRWESELPSHERDERKCMMKDPNHCGRSPTTIATDYADILELSDDLFARKFVDDAEDAQVKDIIDAWRVQREADMQAHLQNPDVHPSPRSHGVPFESQGVLIVAKETVNDTTPLCLGLGDKGNKLRLVPCFYDWVPPNLSPTWETGAVIQEETPLHNRWEVGPCTSDGTLKRSIWTGQMQVTPGNYSTTGPRCMLKQMDGVRAGRCFDGDTGYDQPGGETLVFPCVHRWGQFLSFGDGRLAPRGSMFFSIPDHIVRMIGRLGHEQHPYMCMGVAGRSGDDEERWDNYDEQEEEAAAAAAAENNDSNNNTSNASTSEPMNDPNVTTTPSDTTTANYNATAPLSHWHGEQIVSTPCTNEGAIVEWVFVPYIVEEEISINKKDESVASTCSASDEKDELTTSSTCSSSIEEDVVTPTTVLEKEEDQQHDEEISINKKGESVASISSASKEEDELTTSTTISGIEEDAVSSTTVLQKQEQEEQQRQQDRSDPDDTMDDNATKNGATCGNDRCEEL